MNAKNLLMARTKAITDSVAAGREQVRDRQMARLQKTLASMGLREPTRPIWETWSDQTKIAENVKEAGGGDSEIIDSLLGTRQAIQRGELSRPLPRERGMFNPNDPCDIQAQRKRAEAKKAEEEAKKRELEAYRNSSRWIP